MYADTNRCDLEVCFQLRFILLSSLLELVELSLQAGKFFAFCIVLFGEVAHRRCFSRVAKQTVMDGRGRMS